MAWIDIIPEDEAEGALKREYDAAVRRAGKVWNIVKVQSQNPRTLRASIELYMAACYGSSPLTRGQREMLAVAVSKANGCHY